MKHNVGNTYIDKSYMSKAYKIWETRMSSI